MMIGFTAKITKKRILAALLIVLIPCCFYASFLVMQKKQTSTGFSTIGETVQDRAAFLGQFGWQCEQQSETEKDTVIPQKFDEVYEPYNKIQIAQGFDLSKFKGETVKLYSIKILNYPKNSEYVYATVLVKDGIIIGGDIHSTALNGFMHGFKLNN